MHKISTVNNPVVIDLPDGTQQFTIYNEAKVHEVLRCQSRNYPAYKNGHYRSTGLEA